MTVSGMRLTPSQRSKNGLSCVYRKKRAPAFFQPKSRPHMKPCPNRCVHYKNQVRVWVVGEMPLPHGQAHPAILQRSPSGSPAPTCFTGGSYRQKRTYKYMAKQL